MQKIELWFEKHVYTICVLSVIVFCIVATLFHNDYSMGDIRFYNLPWSEYFDTHSVFRMYDNLFTGAEDNIPAINYPPLFPSWLCLIRPVIRYAESVRNQNILFFSIKSFGLVCHALILLWFCIRKQKRSALFWALCPVWLVLTSFWGQTDESFSFLIWLMLEGFMKHDPYESGISVAISCLLKTQGAMLVIVWLVYLILEKTSWKKKLKVFTASLCTGIILWLPFIISYQNILMPLRFYLCAGSGNNGISWAANALFLIASGAGEEIPPKEYLILSFICLLLCVIIFIKTYKRSGAVYGVLLYLAFMYSFMPGQHERYLVYPMITAWFIYECCHDTVLKTYAWTYLWISVVVCGSRLVMEALYDGGHVTDVTYLIRTLIYLAGSFVTTWFTISLLQQYCGKKQADAIK